MTAAELITARRLALGWTQAELAERVGVNPRTVQRWESGKSRPQNHHLIVLARVLELDPAEFV